MAQLILKGNLETSAILAIQNGPSSVNNSTKYFDDSSNANSGVLEVGNILYDTSDTDPSTGTVYTPGSDGWHWDETSQSAIQLDGVADIGQVDTITPVSYDTLSSNVSNVDEGGSVIFTVATTNIPDGTVVGYTLSGTNIDANDFTVGSLTGTITITSDSGSVTFTLAEDRSTTEGAETLTLTLGALDDNSITTGVLTHDVTINDTSETPNSAPTVTNQTFNVTQNNNPADSRNDKPSATY